jgi:hypothetical protein
MDFDVNSFQFTKQKHTAKTNVWFTGILIGELSFIMKEKPDIDWPKYRADKTLKLSFGERWLTSWKASTASNMTNLGIFENREEAAEAILSEHYKSFEREND